MRQMPASCWARRACRSGKWHWPASAPPRPISRAPTAIISATRRGRSGARKTRFSVGLGTVPPKKPISYPQEFTSYPQVEHLIIHKKVAYRAIFLLHSIKINCNIYLHDERSSDLAKCGSGSQQVDRFGRPPGNPDRDISRQNGSGGVRMCPRGCDAKTPRLST